MSGAVLWNVYVFFRNGKPLHYHSIYDPQREVGRAENHGSEYFLFQDENGEIVGAVNRQAVAYIGWDKMKDEQKAA